ncbi:bel1 homeotic [Plasmopara halstedii]|uniref:Bel1 homeotic n=1 Tax=Plasmopara halstedii TaxID=4781 RepID=A0A0P1B2J6_PLAHL|nr:bel1 homeotic [Plasmopara halstedii]CEG48234.1 bel1 homeotic [Plasmopara halstedii]|eukprot:XP_024584603.1 bel1 homeotic [Plasmopara halstedii]
MMTAQQSADPVQPFIYAHSTRTDALTSPLLPSSPSSTADSTIETTVSGGTAVISSTSPPAATKKRKQAPSPTEDNSGNESIIARVRTKDQQQPSKKSRRELPPHTVAILKGWMLSREHVKHPYPTDEDKQMLLKKTGISMKQLTNWFTNARKRIWKPMMRREHSRQLQSAINFDHTVMREFPGAGRCQQYADSSYAPRATVRHSFDAGSLGALPHPVATAPDRFTRTQTFSVNAPIYPTRVGRSMSEAPARAEMGNYLEPEQFRGRGHNGYLPPNSLSPHGHKILQKWVSSNAQRKYPFPNETERLQLSRETGLDVLQVDKWITSIREQMGTTIVRVPSSIPLSGNTVFTSPSTYGKCRSIPSSGNPMFPPRPTVPATSRPSIISAGGPQFPPLSARQLANETRFETISSASPYPNNEMRIRSMTISAGSYLHPPSTSEFASSDSRPEQQSAGGALPSISSRSLMGRPPPIGASNGPTMGYPRDGRSRTLDMGQFAEARRRKMTFQDILASTGGSTSSTEQAATTTGALLSTSSYVTASSNDVENLYPNSTSATTYETSISGEIQPKHSSICSLAE